MESDENFSKTLIESGIDVYLPSDYICTKSLEFLLATHCVIEESELNLLEKR